MSCDTRDEEVRIIMKYSTIAGTEPTIPTSGDHSDGTWLPTDLYTGELFLNSADDKLWIRTDNGIVGIGGTAGATFSGIYDYVHIAGGTYSGEVYAPTFSSIGIVAQNIYGDQFEGNAGLSASFIGNFYGDGSNLTGIIADWLGGTVSTPVHFTDRVDFTNDTYLDGIIYSNNPNIVINSSLEISGGVSASIFYGDGSGLTNLPTGTYSDTYTSTAALTGNTILFTRNDASDYSVDLTPILATQGVAMIQWDDTIDVLTLYMNDSTELGITIDTFAQVNSTGPITAPEFYGGTFYGSFVGDITGVIGATGPAGSTGPAGPIGATGTAGTLEQTLKAGNTTGTQSIIISSSASIIRGYNGVHHHWYDATNPMLGDYYRIENGTGASSSYIMLEDDVRGNIRIANNNTYDITSNYSENTNIIVGQGDIQHNAIVRDYTGGTVWTSTNQYIGGNGSDMTTRDYIADTTGLISTSTTGVYLQGGRNGGLSASDITITPDTITSRTENDGYSWSQIEQKSDVIIVSGSSEHFRGLEYDNDYSSSYIGYSMVSKDYVDGTFGINDITYADILTRVSVGSLTIGRNYYITDRQIWIEALGTKQLSPTAKKLQIIVKSDVYITDGTWSPTATYAIGAKAVWGGKVWNNLTGAVGSKTDWSYGIYRSLDATNWVEVPNTNTTYYIGKIFDIEYEVATDIIWSQSDDKENHITWDINGDNTPYAYEVTDWGSPLVYGNRNVKVITNNYAQVNDNENIYGYITENTGWIEHNKNVNEYIKTNSGHIFNNNCNRRGSISDNTNNVSGNDIGGGITTNTSNVSGNMNNGDIAGNTSPFIGANMNNGSIYDNTTTGDITFNTNAYNINNNSNTGAITLNSNNGAIAGNSHGGGIELNSNNGYITNNFGSGSIYWNSNNGDITNNQNDGWIRYNTNADFISDNANIGDIERNANNGYISQNSNTGAIGYNTNASNIGSNTNSGYINNNSNNGTIANNTNTGIVFFNSNGGGIFNNSNGGSIESNSNSSDIAYNSNNDYIYKNSNNGYINNNSCWSIEFNSNAGYIENNTSGSIQTCSNNGNVHSNTTSMSYNSNNGDIYLNSTVGEISHNSNNGQIAGNTQTSGTCDIMYNNNNGDIGGARTANVVGTIVNI